MKTKTGRPRVAKAKKRGVFIVTRISVEESRIINKAIRRSDLSQSEWVRKMLLSVAGK
jgi:hypothetical protein